MISLIFQEIKLTIYSVVDSIPQPFDKLPTLSFNGFTVQTDNVQFESIPAFFAICSD